MLLLLMMMLLILGGIEELGLNRDFVFSTPSSTVEHFVGIIVKVDPGQIPAGGHFQKVLIFIIVIVILFNFILIANEMFFAGELNHGFLGIAQPSTPEFRLFFVPNAAAAVRLVAGGRQRPRLRQMRLSPHFVAPHFDDDDVVVASFVHLNAVNGLQTPDELQTFLLAEERHAVFAAGTVENRVEISGQRLRVFDPQRGVELEADDAAVNVFERLAEH